MKKLILFAFSLQLSSINLFPQNSALVIGVKDYINVRERLSRPTEDARKVNEKLTTIGFKTTLLIDNPTYEIIRDKLNNFISEIAPSSTAIVYFSGHGVQFNDDQFFLPKNYGRQSKKDFLKSSFSLNTLIEDLRHSKGINFIILLDTCRENNISFEEREDDLDSIPKQSYQKIIPRYNNIFIGYPTEPGKVAVDNGYFADAITQHLGEEGVNITDTFQKITAYVAERTRHSDVKKQIPFSTSGMLDNIIINPAPNGNSTSGIINRPLHLIANYKFNNNYNDSSLHERHARTNSSDTSCFFSNDRFGNRNSALYLNQNCVLNLGDWNASENHDVTISFWFKASAQTTQGVIFAKGNDWIDEFPPITKPVISDSITISIDKDGKIVLYTWYHFLRTSLSFANDRWHHLAIAIQENSREIFIDGQRQAASILDVGSKVAKTNKLILVGAQDRKDYSYNINNFFLDDLKIFDRAMTKKEILDLYESETHIR